MIESVVARTPILVFILMFMAVGYTIAQNQPVVVIPMGADAGVSGYEIAFASASRVFVGGTVQSITVRCPSGKNVLGGGGNKGGLVVMTGSFPIASSGFPLSSSGWTVGYEKRVGTADASHVIEVYAICADTIN